MSLLASAGTVLAAGSSALVDASGAPTTLGIFASEFFGTFILILLGAGVCAAVTLKKSYAKDAAGVLSPSDGVWQCSPPCTSPSIPVHT